MRCVAGAVCLALSIAGCSAGDGGTSGGGDRTGTTHASTGTGGSGAGLAGSGSGGGFNAGNNDKPVTITQTPVDMGQYIDGGLCQVDMFCTPSEADGDCGSLTLQSTVKMIPMPGNVLLIFDRSFSMTSDWNGMPRWQGAGTAMINALTPLVDLLTIGGVMFPSETPLPNDIGLICGVDAFSSPEQLAFQPGAMALTALMGAPPSGNPSPMYGPVGAGPMDMGVGATPTSEAFQAADVALRGATLTGTTVAVLITDGEPNCMWDQAATTGIAAKWVTDLNIKTYVVGLPGVAGMGGPGMGGPGMGPGNGPAVLNAIAMAGGTDTYIDAADMMTLETKLGAIVTSTVKTGFDSCGMDLIPAADPADKLQLVVSEKGHDENVPHTLPMGGWTVTPDGRHVDLTGSLCDDAKGGRFETVKFEYGCKDLPPLPPDPVPD